MELLDMAGCIITIDTMGTQTAIPSQIFYAKADYVLGFIGNQTTLYGTSEKSV
ncbi:Transposase, IS4 [Richelia intracellularis]|nr:Transposase, IS4 [Richelia intracellularis]